MPRHIAETVAFLRERFTRAPHAILVLGSGLGGLADEIEDAVRIPFADIPGFPRRTQELAGHAGALVAGRLEGVEVAAMQGRFHLYEGWEPEDVALPVRALAAMGAGTLLVTNAAGGIRPGFRPGDLMLIADHINLLGDSPLIGPNEDALGPRFPDMSEPYSQALQEIAVQVATEKKIPLRRGVYVAVPGPNLETRAEYRMLRTLGADVVGMSTVPEVIVAVHGGMRVVGISIITDACMPDALEVADITKIIAVANRAEPKLTELVEGIVERI